MSLDLGTLAGKISIDGADAAEKSISGVQAAMAKLAQTQDPKVKVGADTAAATQGLTGVQRLVQDLSAAKASPTVVADAAQAHADLAALEAELRNVNRTRTVAEITADAQQAMRTAEQVDDQIKALSKKKVEIPVDIDQHTTERGLRGASESVETFRDEAKANLSEVASSFQGSMDSAVDVVQGTLGGVVADLGPAGLIGGALAAAGIGLGKALLSGTADAVNQAKQDVQDLAKDIVSAGGEINSVDWDSKLVDFGTTIVDQKSWWEVWQKDAVTNLDKVRKESEATGQSIGTLLQGEAGGDLAGAKKTLDELTKSSSDLETQIGLTTKTIATSTGPIIIRDQALVDQNDATKDAIKAISAHVDELQDAADAADELTAATQGVTVEQVKANRAIDDSNKALREHAALMGDTKSAQLDYEDAVAKVADGVAKYRTEQIKAYEAQEKAANGGKKLTDAQEKSAIARADADVKAGKALKDSTQAGRDNQRALLALSQDVLAYADATEKQTGSQTEANRIIAKGYDAFVEQAHAAGMSEAAAKAYAKQLGLVPEKVKTTFDLDTHEGQLQLQAFLQKIKSARPTLLVGVKSSQSVVGVHVANGKVDLYAGGGKIRGPGGPRDDKILIAASNDEFVVNAASYRKHAALVEAINNDTLPKYAGGGRSARPRRRTRVTAWSTGRTGTRLGRTTSS
ncbi:hypothetical protein GCM10025864_44530 [Luteimicrobium album]|uniref:Uncharacterized protein n=1 Tax=Luteimicrobium album TaxID=1054550 RepID=A0ABQ6HUS8_9MICO|nr:hypothetical protein [Luteimicrobium album]GMA22288.1 hypothetical protein GCM10025864_00470 [Luteimicrobium album]GMA26694.1 hypothetical protein GCM10025864_44530 [Luteimicrobium album]